MASQQNIYFEEYPVKIIHDKKVIQSVQTNRGTYDVNALFNSIPLEEFLHLFEPKPPEEILAAVNALRYRAQIYVALLYEQASVSSSQWIYFPERDIPFCRVHAPGNFSEALNQEQFSTLVFEYFCFTQDPIWQRSDQSIIEETYSNFQKLSINPKSNRFPNGMGNDSGELGHNVMDHYIGGGASAETSLFADQYYKGRRPNGIYIPRFQNIASDPKKRDYIRGFQFQGRGSRLGWWWTIPEASYGLSLKNQLLQPGNWQIGIMGLGETLPDHQNQIYLHEQKVDQYGLPILVMDVEWRENEKKMAQDMIEEAVDILTKGGLQNVQPVQSNAIPASAVHEMGTARMGRDPKTSVLNQWSQIHAVKNVFVTDGACMTSSACQNPSLTYMALTARAANYAVESLKKGDL